MSLRIQRWYVPAVIGLALGVVACQTRQSSRDRRSETDTEGLNDPGTGDAGNAETTGGKALFPEMEFDFGEVEQDESVTHNFKVRNIGREVLHIKKVRGS